MIYNIYPLRTLSPLHAGIGQGLNDIDLPTARNPVSGHPVIPGSSLKGVLKQEFLQQNYGKELGEYSAVDVTDTLFGKDGNEFASAAAISDANLVALPVRSYYGTFGYLASPYTLQQLKSLLQKAGWKDLPKVPSMGLDNNQDYRVLITSGSVLKLEQNQYILLEELDLKIEQENALADQWAAVLAKLYFADEEGQQIFKKRFAITDDNALNFLCETALPVDARIAIDQETGTVIPGALWYEETVPAETLFAGFCAVERSRSKGVQLDKAQLSKWLNDTKTIHCQVGGKATTGKGFVELSFHNGEVSA